MLTIQNIHKIHSVYNGGDYYVESCAQTDTEYGFVIRSWTDYTKKYIISLDRVGEVDVNNNDGRLVYRLSFGGIKTKSVVTADWIILKDNLLDAMNEVCKVWPVIYQS